MTPPARLILQMASLAAQVTIIFHEYVMDAR